MTDADDFNPRPGVVERLEPGIRRILAPNPSPMTFRGTNTYLVGEGDVAIIDPGPASPAHFDAILAALSRGERISHIFVTHSHLDHSPLAAPLAEVTGAAIHAFGTSTDGMSEVMQKLARGGLAGGGEGIDMAFTPHERLKDRALIEGKEWTIEALWTPGHLGNHLSFAYRDAVFTGDHLMGWASTMVSPPEGDVTAFMSSTERLAARRARVFYPGHGAEIDEPTARADWLLQHRRNRTTQILERLDARGITVPALTRDIYTGTPPALLRAAERNVFAHLIDLHTRGLALADPHLARDAVYFAA